MNKDAISAEQVSIGKMKDKDKGLGKKDLSLERARLAQERTLLAWVRTATTLMTFGFALFKFLEAQVEQTHRGPLLGFITPRIIGVTMLLTGFVGLFLAVIRNFRIMHRLDEFSTKRFFSAAVIQAYVVMALILLLIGASIIR
jgi:putative membrane protein